MSIQRQAMIPAAPAQVYAVLADAALSALSRDDRRGGPIGGGDEFSAFDGPAIFIVDLCRHRDYAEVLHRRLAAL